MKNYKALEEDGSGEDGSASVDPFLAVVETDESTLALGENPMVAQVRIYDTKSLKKDKALTCLHSGIADQYFTSIMTRRHQGCCGIKLQNPLKNEDNELVKDYSARMMDVVNQMRLHGEVVKDQKVVEKMMISVPPKFEAKISAIEESCDLDTLTVSELTRVQQANVSENNQVDDEHLFMASHLDKHLDSLTWLIDSGCISNMTPERSFFISLDTKDNPRVKLGDGRYTRAKGRATLDMENDSYYLKLDVVEFVKTP
ncbi:hypothetical protein Tco_0623894 [Tanacetum coccineum]|uniref:Retrovirus-related Pol polyprotein from transposon TNT 1-94-like beta-barrel domain-containing protein n=1 Tax=Tanacetum coccineum TaxID=301880 RepID=A0ABQ4WCI3_9ASTR